MSPTELAEQARQAWATHDADAAERFMDLIARSTRPPTTLSDVPETPPPSGQTAW